MTSSFVNLPLEKLINRKNIITRLERVESEVGARPSMRVVFLSELGGSLSTGSNLYIDPNGLVLLAVAWPGNSSYIKWIDNNNKITGSIISDYLDGTAGNLYLTSDKRNANDDAFLSLLTRDENQNDLTFFQIQGDGDSVLDLQAGTKTGSSQKALTIRSSVSNASTDVSSVNALLYLDTYTVGTPAAGFGTALVFRAEDTSSDIQTIGYIGAKYTDPIDPSEDSEIVFGWLSGGAQIDGSLISGTWVPTATAGTNVSASTDIVPGTCNYSRVGNRVSFDGVVQVDTTAAGAATFYLTLPIASNFTAVGDANGTAISAGSAPDSGGTIREDTTNDRLQFDIYSQVNTNLFWRFSGGYVVK